ncbi:MAG: hypothetical protein J5716_08465 [Alphaproteobacteria bacterium]|nr:hypothetical protein [Alphaproteobacteria bacterium]
MLLKIVLFVFLLSGGAYAQETPAAQADPATPAPETGVRIRIPHSERTKGNILDAALDFVFMRSFKQFKGLDITYDFFEVDSNYDLNFTNFKVEVKRSNAQGTISVQKIVINFSEFMTFLKSRKALTSKVLLEKLAVDLKLIKKKNKDGTEKEKTRRLKISSKEVFIKDMLVYAPSEEDAEPEKDTKEEKLRIKQATGKESKVSLSNPAEKYAASSFELNDIVVTFDDSSERVEVSSAKANGKSYENVSSFLKAIRR